jgi:hypothetical protein
LKEKKEYEFIFCRGPILNIIFHSVNDCVGGLVAVICQQSGLLGGRGDPYYLGIQIT